MLPPQRPEERHPEHFDDGCPACGSIGRKFLNIGRDHWKYSEKHGLKWNIGSNIFSSWREETEDDWARNEEVLMRCREVELYCPRLPLRTRAQRLWQNLMGTTPVLPMPPDDFTGITEEDIPWE